MTPEARAARERKQKIFVAVGGVALLLLLGLQLPGYLGGSSPAASATTSTELTTGSDPAVTTTPGGNMPVAIAAGAEPAKLSSFSSFSRKDPFVQQVTSDTDTTSSAASAPAGSGGKKEGPAKTPGTTTKFSLGGKSSSAAVTIVSVNGQRQALSPGSAFPASDPVFVLVAEKPGSKAVIVGVKGGAYASGASTTKLVLGKPLTLVNTTTGARYKIVLVAVGSGGEPTAKSSGPGSP